MGLFSTKYKVTASTSTTKLMDRYENPLPGILISAAITDSSLSDAVNSYQTSGLYSKALAYYRRGKNYYPRGLPTGNLRNVNIDATQVLKLIEGSLNQQIEILYILFDADFMDHFISVFLQDTRKVAYGNIEVTVNPAGISGLIFYSHWDQNELTDQVRVHYVNDTGVPVGMELVPFPYKNNKAYQVLYRILTADLTPDLTIDPIYWIYVEATPAGLEEGEEDPDVLIDDGEVVPVEGSSYFPIVPFYEDGEAFGSPQKVIANDPMYVESKKLVNKLGINYDDLAASLAEGTAEAIDAGTGIYAYLELSAEITAGARYTSAEDALAEGESPPVIDIPTEYARIKPHQAVMNYLYDFFMAELGNAIYDKRTFERSYKYGTYKRAPKHNAILITDGSYQYTLSYYYINVTTKPGTLLTGTLGECVTEVVQGSIEVETVKEEKLKPNTTCLFIRKQTSDSSYTEIEICGLAQSFKIYKKTSSVTYLDDAFKTENPLFMSIPLNYELVRRSPAKYRNILIASCMHLVFNSYTIQEVKWYQTGLFQAIFTIISIVLSPFTGGASLSLLLILRVVAYMIIMNLIIRYIVTPVFKYIAKVLGVEAAAILAVVLTVAALITGNVNLAKNLLELSRYVFIGIDAQLQQEMEDLQKDYAQLRSESELLEKELERAQGLLNNPVNFDPMTMVTGRSTVVWGETADVFITGRLQLPALSLAIIQTPSIFTEMMLRLPTVNETLNIR